MPKHGVQGLGYMLPATATMHAVNIVYTFTPIRQMARASCNIGPMTLLAAQCLYKTLDQFMKILADYIHIYYFLQAGKCKNKFPVDNCAFSFCARRN